MIHRARTKNEKSRPRVDGISNTVHPTSRFSRFNFSLHRSRMILKFGRLFRNSLLNPFAFFQIFSSRFGSGNGGRFEIRGGRYLKYRPPPRPQPNAAREQRRPSRRSLPTPKAATGKPTVPTSSTTPRTHVEDALCRFTCPGGKDAAAAVRHGTGASPPASPPTRLAWLSLALNLARCRILGGHHGDSRAPDVR